MKTSEFTRQDFEAAATLIRGRTAHRPGIGLVLGSGLGDVADAVENADAIPYRDIPGWPHSGVVGHANRLVIGQLEGQTVAVLQGRSHFYEGYSMHEVTFSVRVLQMLGVRTLFLTNAAGGLNKSFAVGDLMLLADHINLLGMAGKNPLRGPNDDSLGARFPDMTIVYDLALREKARQAARKAGFTLREGVYAGLAGPNFETPAEIRMLRAWGADAVGMSTVAEAIVARHAGMRVMGVSGISNMCIDTPDPSLQASHEVVLETGKRKVVPNLMVLIRGVLASLETL